MWLKSNTWSMESGREVRHASYLAAIFFTPCHSALMHLRARTGSMYFVKTAESWCAGCTMARLSLTQLWSKFTSISGHFPFHLKYGPSLLGSVFELEMFLKSDILLKFDILDIQILRTLISCPTAPRLSSHRDQDFKPSEVERRSRDLSFRR